MTMRRRHDAVRGTPAGGYEDSLAGSEYSDPRMAARTEGSV